jgi:hypothetical protein
VSDAPKFTAGPWATNKAGEIIAPAAKFILQNFGYEGFGWVDWDGISADEMKANHNLIAAAPDLYIAVEQAIIALTPGPSETEVVRSGIVPALEAILARARGETPANTTT